MTWIHQFWRAEDIESQARPPDKLYPLNPSLGIVVGTFASVPYVHLQLEAWRRFYPNVPLLIHDDGSHRQTELRRLCLDYGAAFEVNSRRLPHCLGDLSSYWGALRWAESYDVDILLKVSRRWIFLADWTDSLRRLAAESQYHTFSHLTTSFNFGFRTECVGLSVKRWIGSSFMREFPDILGTERHVFVEGYMHDIARELDAGNSSTAAAWRHANPAQPDRNGYARWEFMGDDRRAKHANRLWHDSHTPLDYVAKAEEWGLRYTVKDFSDPNEGAGIGQAPKG